MAEVCREDGEQSDASALVLTNACSALLQNGILVSILEKVRVSCHHRVMEFAQIKEQDGQSKEQELNLGGC